MGQDLWPARERRRAARRARRGLHAGHRPRRAQPRRSGDLRRRGDRAAARAPARACGGDDRRGRDHGRRREHRRHRDRHRWLRDRRGAPRRGGVRRDLRGPRGPGARGARPHHRPAVHDAARGLPPARRGDRALRPGRPVRGRGGLHRDQRGLPRLPVHADRQRAPAPGLPAARGARSHGPDPAQRHLVRPPLRPGPPRHRDGLRGWRPGRRSHPDQRARGPVQRDHPAGHARAGRHAPSGVRHPGPVRRPGRGGHRRRAGHRRGRRPADPRRGWRHLVQAVPGVHPRADRRGDRPVADDHALRLPRGPRAHGRGRPGHDRQRLLDRHRRHPPGAVCRGQGRRQRHHPGARGRGGRARRARRRHRPWRHRGAAATGPARSLAGGRGRAGVVPGAHRPDAGVGADAPLRHPRRAGRGDHLPRLAGGGIHHRHGPARR